MRQPFEKKKTAMDCNIQSLKTFAKIITTNNDNEYTVVHKDNKARAQ